MSAGDAFLIAVGAFNLAAFAADKSLFFSWLLGAFCIFVGLWRYKRPE